MDAWRGYFILIGFFTLITGIYGLLFNKLPYKEKLIKKLSLKYIYIDERKFCKFESIEKCISSFIYIFIGIFGKNPIKSLILFLIYSIISLILYYPLRIKYLNLKKTNKTEI